MEEEEEGTGREGLLEKEEESCGLQVRGPGWRRRRQLMMIWEEGKRVGHLAGPMVAMGLTQLLVQVVSNMMVGHLGQLSLSSAAIATSLTGVTGFSLLLGMASGLETLCGQAYGAQQYRILGIHTYRAIVTLLAVSLPISVLWVSMGKILSFIGQDPMISLEAGKYAIWMIPGLFAYATVQPLMKFLQSQSLIIPMLLSSIATLCFHVPLCWVLVFKTRLGNVGAALSISISYWLNVLLLGIYINFSNSCKATRMPFSMEAFTGISEFLRFALPSAIMICLEWWSFELLILLSGLLPNPELETSVLSICLTSITLLYTIPYGLGAATSTRVSNELGAGNPEGARSAVRVVMFLAVMEAAIVSSTLLASRKILGYAYSNEEEVIAYVTKMVPLVCISVITDSLQGVLSGIARGCGWQHLGAYVNLGSFYLVGIPLAVTLGFLLHMGGRGLWIGIVCGSTTQSVLLSLITWFTNWQQMANIARERILNEKVPPESTLI
ncbi:protein DETOXIFICATION 14-like isoform X1 [Ananas comosus]|uniref:Protein DETOXIFICATION n=1 Tax=Ananas comosus TaxID=4615 RepID=A0A6P5GB44_ANACO|nr:protein DETOXIFICATION 14-like isoform X1 [Ananas comosus]